jgi:uncharacterized protein YidB (DUF937 family)
MGLLDGVLGGNTQQSSGGMSPLTMLLMGVLAYRTYEGKGRLADMLHNAGVNLPGSAPATTPNVAPGNGPVGMPGNTGGGGLMDMLRGNLGSLLGGAAAGGALSGGLTDLLRRFTDAGHGDTANSWINTGANHPVTPQQIEQSLGANTVNSLAEQAGMTPDSVLSHLSQGLPDVVDKLTPEGRLPTPQEARWA